MLSEGVSPNWAHQSALSASEMAAMFGITQASDHLPSRTHPTPVSTHPLPPPQALTPLRPSPQSPHFVNHHYPTPDQPHLHTALPPAQLPGRDAPTLLTNGLQNCPSGPSTQPYVSVGSARSNAPASFPIASTTPAPFLEEPYLRPRPPLSPHSQPNSSSWPTPASRMDSSQSLQPSASSSSSSSRQQPHSASDARVATPQAGLPSASALKYYCKCLQWHPSCVCVCVCMY